MSLSHLDDFRGTERFTVRRRLGAGGMGVVYEAVDLERDQRVALKTILHLDASSLYRFKNEFRNVSELSHPNLVRLYELFSDGALWFYTMELVHGVDFLEFVCPGVALPEDDPLTQQGDSLDVPSTSLADRYPTASMSTEAGTGVTAPPPLPPSTLALSDSRSTEPDFSGSGETSVDYSFGTPPDRARSGAEYPSTVPIDPAAVAPPPAAVAPARSENGKARPAHLVRLKAALRQMAEVLAELHAQGRLHRDIKPSNVLVTRRGRVVLLDFGLSTVLQGGTDHNNTTDGKIVGTVAYMAPEQAAARELTAAADWYSVGVMLYRALTGRLPFAGNKMEVLMAKQTAEPPPPSAVAPGVPADLDALCVDLLRRRPEDRPGAEEVLRRLGSSPAGVARLGSQARPFVGRASQLAALRESYAALDLGRAVAAFVHGRSGVGKSACVQRFLDELADRGEAVVLSGRCYEQESVAYKALDTLIDALTRFLKRLTRLEADALMPRDVSALARVFPVLRRVEAVAEAPQRAAEVPDQQELRRRAFAALREMLVRIGDRRPLVLVIDDLQWGDLDSAALLTDLLRPPEPPVLMLLCSYRGEDSGTSPCLRSIFEAARTVPVLSDRREVLVQPLTIAEGRDLALALIGLDDPAAQVVAEMIVREAGGSPYFVYELVQYLKEGGDLADSLANSSEISLDAVLWRRITRLPAEARELLEVLALAGRPLRQAVACRAAGQGADGFTSLGLLRANHLIRGTGPGMLDDVETYHDRIRETVVRRLDAATRRRWHAGLSRELEAVADTDAEALAVHFEGADVPEKAGLYYGRAADEAAESLAFDRAVKLYRRALELRPADDDEGRRLRARLGDALANAGRSYDAARAYLNAAEGAQGRAEQLDLQRRAAYQFLVGGHIDEGLGAFAAILDRLGMPLPGTPRRALARLLVSRARLRLRGLRFRERDASQVDPQRLELIDVSRSVAVGISVVDVIRGSDYQTRSLLLALQAGEPLRVTLALGWEAVHSACAGRASRRRTSRLIATSEALAERVGHPHALGMARLSTGAARYLEENFLVGLERLDEAEAILREQCTGVIWELDTARIFGLWALFYLGRLSELNRRCDRLFREARERGDRYLEATPGPYVGPVVRLADDDVAAARDTAEQALGSWSQRGFHIQHLCHYYGRLYIALYEGDSAGAWARIGQTAPLLQSSLLLRIQHVRADVYQHGGRAALAAASASPGEAVPLLREAEAYARRLDRERTGWTVAMARLVRAGVASVRGDSAAAVRLLRDAVGHLERCDAGLFAASARRRLGRLLGGDEGRALVAEADAWMRAQGVRNPARMAACMAPGFPESD